MEWTFQTDRVTRDLITSTCTNCEEIEYPEPNPDYKGPTKEYLGYTVPVITQTVKSEREKSPQHTDTTNGYWQYVGTETRIYDGITGRLVETNWDLRNLFTGTYKGTKYTAEYFGDWDRGREIIIYTNYPLGELPK